MKNKIQDDGRTHVHRQLCPGVSLTEINKKQTKVLTQQEGLSFINVHSFSNVSPSYARQFANRLPICKEIHYKHTRNMFNKEKEPEF